MGADPMRESGRILVTGGSGLVGRALVRRLVGEGRAITLAGRRRPTDADADNLRCVEIDGIGADTDWRPALEGCATVIHLAAQVPLRGVPADRFMQVNDLGTGALVDQAAGAGVQSLILASSIHAGGEPSGPVATGAEKAGMPTTPYGRSKLAAERHVERFCATGGAGISVRFPLVYDARAQGNWHLLQRLAATGMPLPFGAAENRRSMIALANAVDALAHLTAAPPLAARSGVFTVSDEDRVSLREIFILLRQGMGMPPRLFALPPEILAGALKSIGLSRMASSLLGELAIDNSRFRETFGWSPPVSSGEAIRSAGAAFRKDRSAGRDSHTTTAGAE